MAVQFPQPVSPLAGLTRGVGQGLQFGLESRRLNELKEQRQAVANRLQRAEQRERDVAEIRSLESIIGDPKTYSIQTRHEAYQKLQQKVPGLPTIPLNNFATNDREIIRLQKQVTNIGEAVTDPKHAMTPQAAARELNTIIGQLQQFGAPTEAAEGTLGLIQRGQQAQVVQGLLGRPDTGPPTRQQQLAGEAVRTEALTPSEALEEFRPEERKPLTLSQSDAQLTQKAFRVGIENLNPAEQARFQFLTTRGKGMAFRILPDGTVEAVQGGTLSELSEPTPPFKTQIQKETFSAVSGLQELNRISEIVTPDLFGIKAAGKKFVQEAAEGFVPGITKGKGILAKPIGEVVDRRDKLFRKSAQDFAEWIKVLTGVQFGEKEAERLMKGYPIAMSGIFKGDNFAEYTNKMEDIIDQYIRSVARMKRFNNPTDKRVRESIFNSVPLGAITQEEIDAVKREMGMSDEATSPQTAEGYLQKFGGK